MLLLAVSLALIPAAQQRTPESEFAKLFPHATGQNGLEDYVKAGDLLNVPTFEVFRYWLPAEKRTSPEVLRRQEEAKAKLLASMTPEERKGAEYSSGIHLTPEDLELAQRLNGLNYLQTRQEEVRRFQLSLDLMVQGNRKPFDYSVARSDGSGAEDFRIGHLARRVADLASDAVLVDFASGESDRGVEMLTQALLMAHHFGSGNFACRRISADMIANLLWRFNENLHAVSLEEARRLENFAGTLLDERATFIAMIRNEKQRMAGELDEALRSGLLEKPKLGEKIPLNEEYEKLSPDQKAVWNQRFHTMIDDRYDSLVQRFDSPEENWLVPKEPEPLDPSAPQTLDQMAALMSRAIAMGFDQRFMIAVVTSRAQIRLLRLHASIIEFGWQWGRFPASLEELKLSRDDLYDPLSRKPFTYKLSNGTYSLSSAGNPETGPIELRYRPPKSDSTHDPDRP